MTALTANAMLQNYTSLENVSSSLKSKALTTTVKIIHAFPHLSKVPMISIRSSQSEIKESNSSI